MMSERLHGLWILRYGWERRYRRQKMAERFWMGASDRLPHSLRYWTFVRVGADATTGEKLRCATVPEVPFLDVLQVAGEQLGMD
jgi:hypothetical protein